MIYNIGKRVIDLFVSLVVIWLLWPIFIVICIMIKLDSEGPCLFKQIRIGKDKKPFLLFKFRSMVSNAEGLKPKLKNMNEVDGPVFKIEDDPRLTRVGRFLRDTNLDELPQLFNVFLGDMSLIGPRPALLEEVINYEKDRYNKRFEVTPGMASLFHIMNKKGIHCRFNNWMRWDLYYVKNRSLYLDFYTLIIALRNFVNQLLFNARKIMQQQYSYREQKILQYNKKQNR